MQLAFISLVRLPPKLSGSAWHQLHVWLWASLLMVLLATLTFAWIGEELLQASSSRGVLLILMALSLGLIASFGWVLLRQADRQARSLKQAEAQVRELSLLATHLQARAEQERMEVAHHLHDELGGLLTAAKMDLSWLQSRTEGVPLRERLTQLGGVLDEAMDLKRRVVEDLRPSLLDHFGLPTALRAYVEASCQKAGLVAELSLPQELESLPRETAIALFRMVQEGLNNILRHAAAHTVRLSLTEENTGLLLVLSDDGRGFDPARTPASCGLLGLRQRVQTLGGEMTLRTAPGRGTTLRVQVPRRAP